MRFAKICKEHKMYARNLGPIKHKRVEYNVDDCKLYDRKKFHSHDIMPSLIVKLKVKSFAS